MILFYLNMVPSTLHICDYNLKLSVPVILAESYVHWSVELTFPSHVAAKHAEFGIEAEVAHNWTTHFYLKLCGFCSVTFSFNGFFPSSNIELNMCRTQCKWTLTLAFAHLYWVRCMESVMLARQSALSQDHLSVAWILTRASCVPKIWIPIALYHYSGYTAQTSRFTPITFTQVYLNSNFNGTLYSVYIIPRSSIAHFQTARLLTQHVSVAWELRHFVVFRQIIVFCCRFLPYIVAGFTFAL